MKLRASIKITTACWVVAFGLFGSASSYALPSYTLTDLGIPPGYVETKAAAINNAGQVAGNAFDSNGLDYGFIYSSGSMTMIGVIGSYTHARAVAMNNSGEIVGTMLDNSGGFNAFSYLNGVMVGIVPAGSYSGAQQNFANDVNDSGLVVGGGPGLFPNDLEEDAWVFPNTDLGIITGYTGAEVMAVSNSGQMLLSEDNGLAAGELFLYKGDGTVQDLGIEPNGGVNHPYSFSSSGEIIGSFNSAGLEYSHPFLYSNGTVIDLASVLGAGSDPNGINSFGDIVGGSYAWVYIKGVFSFLSKLSIKGGEGWLFYNAAGINDSGQIAGDGFSPVDNADHAFLLTPTSGGGGSTTVFSNQAGTFAGLVGNNNGMVTIGLRKTGRFTGSLVLGGTTYALSGLFDGNGDFSRTVGRTAVPVSLHINLSDVEALAGSYLLTGSAGGIAFSANHAAYGAGQTAAEAGKYTMLLNETYAAPASVDGQIFVAISGSPATIGEYTTSGGIVNAALVSGLTTPMGIALSGSNLFVVDREDGQVDEYTTSGAMLVAPLVSGLDNPYSVVISGTDMFVSIQNSPDVDEFSTSGTAVSEPLFAVGFAPSGLALSGSDLFVVDGGTKIGEYTTSGATVKANLISGLSAYGFIALSGTNLFAVSGTGSVGEYTTSGATINANLITGLKAPTGIAVYGGNLFVTNYGSGTIGEYTTSGTTVNAALVSGLNEPTGIIVTPAPVAPGTVPQGAGYATLTVSRAGGVIMAGKMADGAVFRATGLLVGGMNGNRFLIYDLLTYPSVVTARSKGLLAGSLTFEQIIGSDIDGTLEWIKPEQKPTRNYPAAIDTNLAVIGSHYAPPMFGSGVLPGFPAEGGTSSGTLALSDTSGIILSGTTQLSDSNKLIISNPQDRLNVAITPSTGTFRGTFMYPVPGNRPKPTAFAGVLFQDQTIGSGFFQGPNGGGTVSLTYP